MGTLYVVATPIGNLEDITLRAVKTLLTTKVIACEDTRKTGQLIKILFDRYKFLINLIDLIPKKYISVRDWNEAKTVESLIKELQTGDVTLVSDAGTPLISDPGYKVVSVIRAAGFKVVPIPGPSALTAALCAAGLPTDKFMFLGFWKDNYEILPHVTTVIYESPARTDRTLKTLKERYPGIQITLARELTKIHEYIGPDDGVYRGEITIVANYDPSLTKEREF